MATLHREALSDSVLQRALVQIFVYTSLLSYEFFELSFMASCNISYSTNPHCSQITDCLIECLQVYVLNFNPYFKKNNSERFFIVNKYSSEIHIINYPEDILSSEYEKSNDVSPRKTQLEKEWEKIFTLLFLKKVNFLHASCHIHQRLNIPQLPDTNKVVSAPCRFVVAIKD